jgi:hypothetical protein
LKTAGWTVSQSSSSVSAGSGDLITDQTKLVWAIAGSVHSWVVLKNTTLGADFSVCIDCNFASSSNASVTILSSVAGYQAGTTTNRPVVNVGGVEHNFGTIYLCASTASTTMTKGVVVLYSSDGECLRMFSSFNTGLNASPTESGCVLMFEKLENPVSWLSPNIISFVTTASSVSSTGFRYLLVQSTTNVSIRTEVNSNAVNVAIGTIGLGNAVGNTVPGNSGPDYGGNYLLTPCFAISLNTSYPGILGKFYDMYLAPQYIPEGVYLKTSLSSKGLIKIGDGAFGCSGNTVIVP